MELGDCFGRKNIALAMTSMLFLLFEDYNWLLGPGIGVRFDQQQCHLDRHDGMLKQVGNGHHHWLIGTVLGAEVAIFLALTCSKLTIDLS